MSCRINAIMPGVTDIVSAAIPCLGEEDAIGAVVASLAAISRQYPCQREEISRPSRIPKLFFHRPSGADSCLF